MPNDCPSVNVGHRKSVFNWLQVLKLLNMKKISIYLISSFQRIFFGSYFHLTDKLINHPLQHFLSNERKFQINFFPGDECFLPQKPWYQGQFPSQNILQGLLAREKLQTHRRNSWSSLRFPAQCYINISGLRNKSNELIKCHDADFVVS